LNGPSVFDFDHDPVERDDRRGVIISPGALGDGVLMLPLARFMKEAVGLTRLDFIGHRRYTEFYPGRTCVDVVRDIDSIEFHRLFAGERDFAIEDNDRLVRAFSGYEWIVSFLGEGNADFEGNLAFTVNCSRSAEVVMLALGAPPEFAGHISEHYVRQFAASLVDAPLLSSPDERIPLVQALRGDIDDGRAILERVGIRHGQRVAVIHPGSGGAHKCWPVENFCRLAGDLGRRSAETVFVLGPAEEERLAPDARERLGSAGTCVSGTSVVEVLQIIACADVFVGNDSGVTHLAAAMGTPTVAVFGPSDPIRYRPLGPRVTVVLDRTAQFASPGAESAHKVLQAVDRCVRI